MSVSKNHKAVWKPASETREQRRERLTARRDRQHALQAGVIKTNLLWSTSIDPNTHKPRVKLFQAPVRRTSKYMPHQGQREIARRLRQAQNSVRIAA